MKYIWEVNDISYRMKVGLCNGAAAQFIIGYVYLPKFANALISLSDGMTVVYESKEHMVAALSDGYKPI